MQLDVALHVQIDSARLIPLVRPHLVLIVTIRVDEFIRLLLDQIHIVEQLDTRAGHRRYADAPQKLDLR